MTKYIEKLKKGLEVILVNTEVDNDKVFIGLVSAFVSFRFLFHFISFGFISLVSFSMKYFQLRTLIFKNIFS